MEWERRKSVNLLMLVKSKHNKIKRIYHFNVNTNERLRSEINNSKLSTKELILKYDVSQKTIRAESYF